MNPVNILCWIAFILSIISAALMVYNQKYSDSLDITQQNTALFCFYVGFGLSILAVISLFTACML